MPTNEMREFITGLIASLTEKLDDLGAPWHCGTNRCCRVHVPCRRELD
jgi:hypothetical protein